MKAWNRILAALLLLQWCSTKPILVHSVKEVPNNQLHQHRPTLVQDALRNNKPLYYFGLGSNMSRKKLENRGLNNTKIKIQSMKAGVVKNYRLAFNLRGFPPLEPGMGSLEPTDSGSKALLRYHDNECHGALVKLTPENYEKVMRSEGVGDGSSSSPPSSQGYEEIVVDCYPYGSPTKPVKAIALRARPHVRLAFDPCPSARYMNILKEGAKELGLKTCYQEFLAKHPVQELTQWQRRQAIFNLIFTLGLSVKFKARWISRLQSRLLFLVYVSPKSKKWVRYASTMATALILLPGASVGYLFYQWCQLRGNIPLRLIRMMELLGDSPAAQERETK